MAIFGGGFKTNFAFIHIPVALRILLVTAVAHIAAALGLPLTNETTVIAKPLLPQVAPPPFAAVGVWAAADVNGLVLNTGRSPFFTGRELRHACEW